MQKHADKPENKVLNEIKNRGFDIGQSILNLLTEGIGGFFRTMFSGIKNIFSGLIHLFKQDYRIAYLQIIKGLLQIFIKPSFNASVVFLQNSISILQTLIGVEEVGHRLLDSEIAALQEVFGSSLNLHKIRLKEGEIGLNNFIAPHTIGNTIYIPKGWLDINDAKFEQNRMQLLVHESVHVWQYQNGGTDYIGASIWHQTKGVVYYKDRNAAYNFGKRIKAQKTWSELNPEQQAHLIDQAYYQKMFAGENERFILDDGSDVTKFFRYAKKQLLEKKGAA